MAVIIAVTSHAIRRRLAAGAGCLPMAVGTGQLSVCAGEREMRLLVVIELPDRPAIGRMTTLALAAEPAVVHILRGMTAVAVDRRCAE